MAKFQRMVVGFTCIELKSRLVWILGVESNEPYS